MWRQTRDLVREYASRTAFGPLLALWAITVVLVPPWGEFPLNDDWAYTLTARMLAEKTEYRPHPFTPAYALPQAIYGAALISTIGFSYTILRASTLVMALLCVWAVSRGAKELGCSKAARRLAAALVFCNPLFLNLAYTYMTEVPFMTWSALSILFYLRALRRLRSMDLLLGGVLAAIAFFNRQYGALIPAAFLLTIVVFAKRAREHANLPRVAALVAPGLLGLLVWLMIRPERNSSFPWISRALTYPDFEELIRAYGMAVSVALYFGLFCMPISAGLVAELAIRKRRWRPREWAVLAAVLLFVGLHLARWPAPLPRLQNVLYDFGVGPLLLRGDGAPPPVRLGNTVWWVITIACAGSIGVAVAQLASILGATARIAPRGGLADAHRARAGRPAQYAFLALLALVLLAAPYNPATPIYYDRYLLPGLIPLALLLAVGAQAGAPPRPAVAGPAVFVLAIMYVFSLAATQDYLAWNRARWHGIATLHTKYGAGEHMIDGGFEYIGLHAGFPADNDEALDAKRPDFREMAWSRYVVSYAPLAGYEEPERVPYFSWLGFQTRDVCLLKRIETP